MSFGPLPKFYMPWWFWPVILGHIIVASAAVFGTGAVEER